jgi:5-methylcytosine-specific restriction endonuclease McrA
MRATLSKNLPEWMSSDLFNSEINEKRYVTFTGDDGEARKFQLTRDAVLVEKSNGACPYCDVPFLMAPGLITVDHLIPKEMFKRLREKGETSVLPKGNYRDNLCASCIACNLLKNNWPIDIHPHWGTWLPLVSRDEYVKEARAYITKKREESCDESLIAVLRQLDRVRNSTQAL